jgi:signal peptidase II
MERSRARLTLFWSILSSVVIADILSKMMAVSSLIGEREPREVFGEWFRFVLVYNQGAAFGVSVGAYSRWIFLVLTLLALTILVRMLRATREDDRLRIIALGLICGGAIGNLYDRIRSPLGVVDFIDIGVGTWRWPTFNMADIAVSVGAFLLAWALWAEESSAQLPAAAPSPDIDTGGAA